MLPGAIEILVVIAIVAVFFGPGKLPEVMSSLGKSVKEFKDATDEARHGTSPAEDDREDA